MPSLKKLFTVMNPFMGHTLRFIVISFAISACSDNSDQEGAQNNLQADKSRQTLTSSAKTSANNDTLIVDKKAAVFIEPDSIRKEKGEKTIG